MGKELTEERPMAAILRFTLPLLVGNIFQQLYNMADTIIVGRFVGQNALAAVGSTGTIMFLVLGFSQGLTTGFTVLTSQRYGAGDAKGTKRSVANGLLLSILVILVITAASVASMRGVLTLMQTPGAIFDDALTYITIICWGTVCSVFYNLFSALMRAVGNSKMPLVFLVFSACLNVVLDLVLVIVFDMGVAGAAIATDISQGISAFLSAWYILVRMRLLVPERGMWYFGARETSHQMRVGIPMALQFAITASGTMIMQAAINGFGAVAVASYTAASKVQNVLTQGFASLGQTMASYCGQNYGKGSADRIRQGIKSAVKANLVYSVVVGALALLTLRPAMSLFFAAGTDLDAMLPYATIYMRLCVAFYIPLGLIFIFRNTMQGCGFGLLPMLGGIVELICRLIMAFAAMRTANFTLAAFCDPFAWLGAGIFTAVACAHVMKQVEKILAGA